MYRVGAVTYMSTSLTPRDAKILIRYLDAVDDAVTERLEVGYNPSEENLTFLLCEMLDDNKASRNTLSYPLTQMKAELAADSKRLVVSLAIETRQYPRHIESRLTSSDIGIIVSYRDHVRHNSFESGVLLQAKRLYHSLNHPKYSLNDSFEAFDRSQLKAMLDISQRYSGPDMSRRDPTGAVGLCRYLFYCPRPNAYDEDSQEELQHYLLPGANIFDYAKGWHLYEFASDPKRHVPGLLASSISWLAEVWIDNRLRKSKPVAREVFERLWHDVEPLSWFLVYGMILGRAGCHEGGALDLVRGRGSAVEQFSAETPILPRFVLTVDVEVGVARG